MDAEKDVEKAAAQEATELADEQLDEVAGGSVTNNTCERCGHVGLDYLGNHVWECPVCGWGI